MFRKTLLAALIATCATAASAATTTVKVIAFNDFHGTLESPGTFGVQPGGSGTTITSKAAGGVDYLAGWVKSFKAANPNNVVVSAGDLIGASPLISAFFHDEGTIETMNRLGLEFNAVGNHEFDEGRTELLRMQNGGCHPTDTANTCKGAQLATPAFPAAATPVPFEGAKFRFLAANVVNSATGKTVLAPYGIKTFANNVRVAFIGMTLKDTPSIVTPSGVEGLTFNDEADTVNALIPQLKARGVNAIVVLLHQGGFQGSASPNFINDCSAALQDDTTSPIRRIVGRLDDAVDLVVSGHTHTGFICNLPNKAGRSIPVTQASSFGRVLTQIDLNIDNSTGDVVAASASNVTVDRTGFTPAAAGVTTLVNSDTGVQGIKGIVAGYSALVSPLANQVIGTITAPLPNTASTAGEMEAGDLIADAQLAATQSPSQAAVIALMNAGGVRSPGFNVAGAAYPYDVTYQNAFTVQPFGNSLVTLTLTGQQLKDVLEQQFIGGGCLLPSGKTNNQTAQRVLQISAGLKIDWSASAPACGKIQNVSLTQAGVTTPLVQNGTVLNPAASYRVTVNNFMATGGDNFSVLTLGSNLVGGAQDIDALVAYMAAFKAPNPAYNPTDASLQKPRVTRLP